MYLEVPYELLYTRTFRVQNLYQYIINFIGYFCNFRVVFPCVQVEKNRKLVKHKIN